MKIAHIINIFRPSESSSMYTAQPITLESMRRAVDEAKPEVAVSLFAAVYEEDSSMIPDFFNKTAFLTRSVADFNTFDTYRKLPLIADILEALYTSSDADYLIYTNNDIILHRDFYKEVKHFIDEGHDAFIINRRRVSERYTKVKELPQILTDKGKSHPGFDCFVFHRKYFPQMKLGHICIGVPFIGVTLAHNLFCFAQNLKLYDNLFLTFHIGMQVMSRRDDYYWYNRNQFNIIIHELKPLIDIRKFPYANKPFIIRYIKWGLNPSLFVFMNIRLELLGFVRRYILRKPLQ